MNAIIKRDDRVLKFLVGFVAFAGNQNGVAGFCGANRVVDSPRTVLFDPAGIRAYRAVTLLDLRGDRGRDFFSRIIAGDDV